MYKKLLVFLCITAFLCLSLADRSYGAALVYISNSDDGTVSVIDSLSATVIDTINVGNGPIGVAVSKNGDYVYVANSSDNTVSVIETANNTITNTITVGTSPWGVAAAQDGDFVYVTNNTDGTVSVISTADYSVSETIDVGNSPMGIAVTPEGDFVYVANNEIDDEDGIYTVSVINTEDYSVGEIEVGENPIGVAVTSNGIAVYVTMNAEDLVYLISTADNSVAGSITVGDGPWGVTADYESDFAYVANYEESTVSKITISDSSVGDPINVGDGPKGVAVTNDGQILYVVNNKSNTVSRIDLSDNNITSIQVGNSPASIGNFIGGKPSAAPSDLQAVTQSYERIDLSWTDNSNDEYGFRLERKLGSSGTYSIIATLDPNVTSYVDTELQYYRTYYYRIVSYNDAANSDYSNEASTTTEDYDTECFIAISNIESPFDSNINALHGFRGSLGLFSFILLVSAFCLTCVGLVIIVKRRKPIKEKIV